MENDTQSKEQEVNNIKRKVEAVRRKIIYQVDNSWNCYQCRSNPAVFQFFSWSYRHFIFNNFFHQQFRINYNNLIWRGMHLCIDERQAYQNDCNHNQVVWGKNSQAGRNGFGYNPSCSSCQNFFSWGCQGKRNRTGKTGMPYNES